MPLCHKKKFNGKGVTLWILIKQGQEGIIRKFLQNQFGIEIGGEAAAQGGLACADVTFDN
jgi:hypothetical protein